MGQQRESQCDVWGSWLKITTCSNPVLIQSIAPESEIVIVLYCPEQIMIPTTRFSPSSQFILYEPHEKLPHSTFTQPSKHHSMIVDKNYSQHVEVVPTKRTMRNLFQVPKINISQGSMHPGESRRIQTEQSQSERSVTIRDQESSSDKIQSLVDRIHDLASENQVLTEKIRKLEQGLQSQKEDIKQQVMRDSQEMGRLKVENEELYGCNREYEGELRTLISRMEGMNLMKESRNKNHLSKELESLKETTSSNIKVLTQKVHNLNSELQLKTQQLSQISQANQNLTAENIKINKTLIIREQELISFKAANTQLEENLKEMEATIDQMSGVEVRIRAMSHVDEEVQQLHHIIEHHEEQLKEKDNEAELLQTRFDNLTIKRKNEVASFDREREQMKESIKSLTKSLEAERKRNLLAEKDGGEKEGLREKVRLLVLEFDSLKEKLFENVRTHDIKMKAVMSKKESSELQLTTKSTSLVFKEKELEERETEISRLEGELAEWKEKHINVQKQLQSTKSQLSEMFLEIQHRTSNYIQSVRTIRHDYENAVQTKLRPYVSRVHRLQGQLEKSGRLRRSRTISNVESSFKTSIEPSIKPFEDPSTTFEHPQTPEGKIKIWELRTQFFKEKNTQLQDKMQHLITSNKEMAGSISKLHMEIGHLKEELSNSEGVRDRLFQTEWENMQSSNEIQELNVSIKKVKDVTQHQRTSLNRTISELKAELNEKSSKMKEMSSNYSDLETENSSLIANREINFERLETLCLQKMEIDRKGYILNMRYNKLKKEVCDKEAIIDKLEAVNRSLCEELSKVNIELHMKELTLLETKSEALTFKAINESLMERLNSLSEEVTRNSCSKSRDIVSLGEDVEKMLVNLEMRVRKDSAGSMISSPSCGEWVGF